MERLWLLLVRTVETLRNCHMREEALRFDARATVARIRVLGAVLMNPEGRLKVKELAEELNITSGAVSQIVEKLVWEEMLLREADREDRRVVWVSLSPRGQEMRRRHDAFFAARIAGLLEDMPPEKLQVCMEVLETLFTRLEQEKDRVKVNMKKMKKIK